MINYNNALVRGLSPNFTNGLKRSIPQDPINLSLAERQHQNYIDTLKKILPTIFEIEGDTEYPDCNFVEDTAIIVGNTAILSILGAESRQGEERRIKSILENIPHLEINSLTGTARMDGGDILFTGDILFFGISERTNIEAYQQVKKILNGKVPIFPIDVESGLHLKSMISILERNIIICAEVFVSTFDQFLKEHNLDKSIQIVSVPDEPASNVLSVNRHLIIQDRFPKSERILMELAKTYEMNVIKLDMSELIKADGALTCGSILF
ncbi:arginine deiminase family protein [Bacteriovoracaceae bacterium]|nr:arginine deiminase family protein [Bacteriovoracaceae bacterium]